MEQNVIKLTKNIVLIFAFLLSTYTLHAQKLPNIQNVSLWAPDNIKIDGNLKEWNDQFRAYNKATEIYYTLSNNDENIYLTVKVKSSLIIDKIIRNGISFTINHTLKKKDISPVIITYPILDRADRNSLSGLYNHSFGIHSSDNKSENPLPNLNISLDTKSKFISVKGIKEIPDEIISVYNDQDIKAVSKFDKPLIYAYELKIPLKFLALPNNGISGFSYHVKLNADPDLTKPITVVNSNLPPPPEPDNISMGNTDFWGEYTLAKK